MFIVQCITCVQRLHILYLFFTLCYDCSIKCKAQDYGAQAQVQNINLLMTTVLNIYF